MNKAEEIVRQYLAAMERRDLAAAKALVEWAKGRYRSARKTYDRYETCGDAVYFYGTLNGELLDGSSYSGIRFIDGFTVRDGKLAGQNVWNDMAEVLRR